MDAASALADLTEISSQVEAAVVIDDAGAVVASTLADAERSARLARAAVDLLGAADKRFESGGGALTQLEAALQEGSVFVAREEGRSIVATTGAEPTSGLVFYDLKTCLRSLAQSESEPKAKRARPKKRSPKADSNSQEETGA
jgi:predicted regulator of Ras-like GTPase activity (Roadblock/LC7/MglB family)